MRPSAEGGRGIPVKPAETAFTLVDRVTNLSAFPASSQLLYHYNLGGNLLGPDARIAAPVAELVPRDITSAVKLDTWDQAGASPPDREESVFYMKLAGDARGRTLAMLVNGTQERGAVIRFQLDQLPCFTIWKNLLHAADGAVVGLEPGTNFPIPYSFERGHGRYRQLAPGETASFELSFEYLDKSAAIEAVQKEIEEKMSGRVAARHPNPVLGWSPNAAYR